MGPSQLLSRCGNWASRRSTRYSLENLVAGNRLRGGGTAARAGVDCGNPHIVGCLTQPANALGCPPQPTSGCGSNRNHHTRRCGRASLGDHDKSTLPYRVRHDEWREPTSRQEVAGPRLPRHAGYVRQSRSVGRQDGGGKQGSFPNQGARGPADGGRAQTHRSAGTRVCRLPKGSAACTGHLPGRSVAGWAWAGKPDNPLSAEARALIAIGGPIAADEVGDLIDHSEGETPPLMRDGSDGLQRSLRNWRRGSASLTLSRRGCARRCVASRLKQLGIEPGDLDDPRLQPR